jgi:NAD+ kinase
MIVGVTGNPRYEGLRALLARVSRAATVHGFSLQTESDLAKLWPAPVARLDLDGAPPDLVVCFGGDGTFLRTARVVGARRIPILGVKIGRVGFLTTAVPDTLDDALAAAAAGAYQVEPRRVLSAALVDATGRVFKEATALNDVAVHKAGVARVIRLRVMLDDEEIGAFASDGLIVATPTGSTAYSLSAGGPVVVPSVDAVVVTPICPHTLAVRPIVVPADARLTIDLMPPYPEEEEVLVSYDGQVGEALDRGMRVVVTRGAYEALLVRLGTEGFFARMRRMLSWGDLTDRERE